MNTYTSITLIALLSTATIWFLKWLANKEADSTIDKERANLMVPSPYTPANSSDNLFQDIHQEYALGTASTLFGETNLH